MKPCKQNRQLIAWLVIGDLDEGTKLELEAHLQHCEGCREYFHEVSQVAGTLGDKAPAPHLEASDAFHRRLVGKLKASRQGFGLQILERWRHAPAPRKVAFPVLAAAALGVVALLAVLRSPEVLIPTLTKPESQAAQYTDTGFEPTISNYKMVANQSFDRFDELLTQQGTRNLPQTPIYTAAAQPMGTGAE